MKRKLALMLMTLLIASSILCFAGSNKTISTASSTNQLYWGQRGYNASFDDSVSWGAYQSVSLAYSQATGGAFFIMADNNALFSGNNSDISSIDLPSGAALWSNSYGLVLRSWSDCGGYIFAGSNEGTVIATQESSGVETWTFPVSGYTSVSCDGGFVLVNSVTTGLYVLNATTGKLMWSAPAISGDSDPSSARNGVVYDNSYFGEDVWALNESTGSLLWISPNLGGNIPNVVVVGASMVYAGTSSGDVYGLNASTGTIIWSFHTGIDTYVDSLQSGVLFAHLNTFSNPTTVYALDANTGKELWSYGPIVLKGGTEIAGGQVFFLDSSYVLHALDVQTGNEIYSFALPGSPSGGADVFVVGNYVVVSLPSELYVLSGLPSGGVSVPQFQGSGLGLIVAAAVGASTLILLRGLRKGYYTVPSTRA